MELMIVVAIIGILAMIAIPAYTDYQTRAQVSEAISITSAFKTGLSDYYQNSGVWPHNLTAVGTTLAGTYVNNTAITVGNGVAGDLVITSTFANTNVSGSISGGLYALSTQDGGLTWDCGNNGLAAATTDIENKFLPPACR